MPQVLVSGSAYTEGIEELQPLIKTIREMNDVDNAFEDFRHKINNMGIQYPQHSLVSNVVSMVQTMAGPYITNEKMQREFAEDIRITVEAIMPWDKFLNYSAEVKGYRL